MTLSIMAILLCYLAVLLFGCRYLVAKIYCNKSPTYRYWTYRSFSLLIFFSSYLFANVVANMVIFSVVAAITNAIILTIGLILLDTFTKQIETY